MQRPAKRPRSDDSLRDTIRRAQSCGSFNWELIAPKSVSDYLQTLAHSVSCSPEQVLMGFLAIIPGLLGAGTKVVVRSTYREPPMLYSVCLVDPGAGRSAAYDLVKKPLYFKDNSIHHASHTPFLRILVDIYHSFTHIHRVVRFRGGLILFSSRLHTFLKKILDENDDNAAERETFCRLHDGTTGWMHWPIDTKVDDDDDDRPIKTPCVVIGGYSRPESFIEAYLNLSSKDDGFADRFLLATPPPLALLEEKMDESNFILEHCYQTVDLSKIYEFIYDFHQKSFDPREYSLSYGAKTVYNEYANEIAKQLNKQWKTHTVMSSTISKDKRTALRLALNLHVFYHVLEESIRCRELKQIPGQIEESVMRQAIELTKYFARQRNIYKHCDHEEAPKLQKVQRAPYDEQADDLKYKKKILLHPGPFVKPRNVLRTLPSGNHINSPKIQQLMQSLQEEGYGLKHTQGVKQVFLKCVPSTLPHPSIVDPVKYQEAFNSDDKALQPHEKAAFELEHPQRDMLQFWQSSQHQNQSSAGCHREKEEKDEEKEEDNPRLVIVEHKEEAQICTTAIPS